MVRVEKLRERQIAFKRTELGLNVNAFLYFVMMELVSLNAWPDFTTQITCTLSSLKLQILFLKTGQTVNSKL